MHISVNDEDGDVLVRDAVIAAFFCQRPYPELAKSFGRVFEEWLAQTPDEAKKWALVGPNAEEYKPVSPKLLVRARAEFDPTRASSKDMCSNEICGPQKINADYAFQFVASRDIDKDETNVLEIRTPTGSVESSEVERYVESIRRVAQLVPYESGYASRALTWGVESQKMAFAREAQRWAFRHPGFDMPNNDVQSFHMGTKLRGPYWLTFIGPTALTALGGEMALRKALPNDVSIERVGVGVMLRCSTLPEVGDVNYMQNLPVLRATAKVLESVTILGDNLLDRLFTDEAQRERWERRHLD